MTKLYTAGAILMLFLGCLSMNAGAQSHKANKTGKVTPAPTPAASSTPKPPAPGPGKKNGRPGNATGSTSASDHVPTYFYEFSRPGFDYPKVLIEHDQSGKGKISFEKNGASEMITDPIDLTPATLENIDKMLTALDFLNSTEDYQTEHDFSNMGNVTITYKKAGRERTAKYNWSDNKDAKALMDEYKRIGYEYTWRFEIGIARQNQPLQTPGLMDQLASYINRGEISDPPHLVPFLTELSNDERLPLIARNHAGKLVRQLQKQDK